MRVALRTRENIISEHKLNLIIYYILCRIHRIRLEMKVESPRDLIDDSRFEKLRELVSARFLCDGVAVISRHREIYRKTDSQKRIICIVVNRGLIIAMTNNKADKPRADVCGALIVRIASTRRELSRN